jgi:glycosyltransferase A (GT-A) superfamily protein (DUF2064 family)
VTAALVAVPAGEPLPGLAAVLDEGRRAALRALLVRRATAWAEAVGDASVCDEDDLAGAIARAGTGPLLIAGIGCPRLGPEHAAAALGDLAAGCDVTFGSTLDGGWYLAGLREPRPELLAVTELRAGGIGAVLARGRELGAEVGLLRHERVLATPGDAVALAADPLTPADVRAALSGA